MKREWLAFACGLLLGGSAVGMALDRLQRAVEMPGSAALHPALKYPLQVKLHRVLIKDGQLDHFSDWLDFLHAHHDESVATLAREHMYVEAMFRDPKNDPKVLYWLEVSDVAGAHVDSSGEAVDRRHMQYMHKVLREDTWSVLDTENVLMPPFIDSAIARYQNTSNGP
jgi:hypothetical protein